MSDVNGVRRGVRFYPTINLGHVLTAAEFLTSTIVAWVNLDARVAQNALDLKRVDGQGSKETVRVETVLMDKQPNLIHFPCPKGLAHDP
jgi:hypothetical protein